MFKGYRIPRVLPQDPNLASAENTGMSLRDEMAAAHGENLFDEEDENDFYNGDYGTEGVESIENTEEDGEGDDYFNQEEESYEVNTKSLG